jgi:surface antigen
MWGMLSTGGADGNGGDGRGYGCRQCASYAAWRGAKETGKYVSWGNANTFDDYASNDARFTVTTTPRANSIGVMDFSPYGHVVWVEAVNGDGTVRVAQYNYNYGAGWGMFSRVDLPAATYDWYIYF